VIELCDHCAMAATASDNPALAAFRDEANAFLTALAGLDAHGWQQPTRCVPWQVRDLVGHVITVTSRVPETVSAPAPDRPDTTAAGYYRADDRFSDAGNADRQLTAHRRAAGSTGAELVLELAGTVQAVITTCRREPLDRIVRTRHLDAMLLSDFLTTRVVELAVRGLDVADAVDRQPWLTLPAAEHLQELLFGAAWRTAVAALDWDPVTLLRKAIGRASITAHESTELARLGLRALTLG
jgi:uncharacterized protein (TIGR03083 family)